MVSIRDSESSRVDIIIINIGVGIVTNNCLNIISPNQLNQSMSVNVVHESMSESMSGRVDESMSQ